MLEPSWFQRWRLWVGIETPTLPPPAGAASPPAGASDEAAGAAGAAGAALELSAGALPPQAASESIMADARILAKIFFISFTPVLHGSYFDRLPAVGYHSGRVHEHKKILKKQILFSSNRLKQNHRARARLSVTKHIAKKPVCQPLFRESP